MLRMKSPCSSKAGPCTPSALQGSYADDAEEDQIVDVDEVAEGGHEDGEVDRTGAFHRSVSHKVPS